jgi:hypothetical protein
MRARLLNPGTRTFRRGGNLRCEHPHGISNILFCFLYGDTQERVCQANR